MENKQLIFDQYFVKRAENYKITAMDYIDNYLYIGTTQGSVFKQRIKTLDSPKGKTLPDGQEVKLFKYGPKQQIIKIACIRSIR